MCEGFEGMLKETPYTCAPRCDSHKLSHDPLKPVCPVKKTCLPFQKEGSTEARLVTWALDIADILRPKPSKGLCHWPTILRDAAYRAAYPSAAKNHYG